MQFCKITLIDYEKARLGFTPCLFALPTYLAQTIGKLLIYGIQDETQALVGIMPFILKDTTAYSPPRATFGGWYSEMDLPVAFLDWVKIDLLRYDITFLEVKLPPVAHHSLPTLAIFRRASQTILTDLNYHIDLAQDFEANLHLSAYRRLKKARQASFIATHWQTPDLPAVYAFISKARKRKGFPLTLTLAQFEEMFRLFPTYYDVFVVYDVETIAALTVTVKLDAHILYNFYPADAEEYLVYSPTVLLLHYVASWAKEKGFAMFDLGIATDAGVRNEGLIRFKKNMGAIETEKWTVKIPC